MAGLVLEGGSFRGIFTAGVMDGLLDNGIEFDYVIGVSAGITNAASYISKQRNRNLEILKRYRNDKRYMGKRNFFKCKSMFGLEFAYDEIPNKLMPFDWETYYNFKGEIRVGMTDALTGEIAYKDGKKMDKKCTLLRATCALPFYFPPITVEGRKYFDGGIADSIPIRHSIKEGNVKNLVILTQPKGFVKEQSKSGKAAAKVYKRRYPGLSDALLQRPNMYNETMDFINQKEKEGSVLVIRPEYKLNSFEKDVNVLEQNYNHGVTMAHEHIESIKDFILN